MKNTLRPHDTFVIFVDRSLPQPRLAKLFKQIGVAYCCHDDIFRPNEQDEIWLKRVGEEGWAALTRDKRIRYHPFEKQALLKFKVRSFVMTATKDLTGEEIELILKAAITRIKKFCETYEPPYIAKILGNGKVVPWLPQKPAKIKKHGIIK